MISVLDWTLFDICGVLLCPACDFDKADNAYIWFVDRIAAIISGEGLNRTPMLWDDPYRWQNTSLQPNTIVQAYRAKDA